MDVHRARSPPASLARRPIGPRSPGKPGSLPVKNIIPLDLTTRLQSDEFGALPHTSSPESLSTGSDSPRPESPAFSSPPVLLQRNASAPSGSTSPRHAEDNTSLRRAESARSDRLRVVQEDGGASSRAISGLPTEAGKEEAGGAGTPAKAVTIGDVTTLDSDAPSDSPHRASLLADEAHLPPPPAALGERTPTPPAVFSSPAPEVPPPETPPATSESRGEFTPPPPPLPDHLPPDDAVAAGTFSSTTLVQTNPIPPPPKPASDLPLPDGSMHAVPPPYVAMHADLSSGVSLAVDIPPPPLVADDPATSVPLPPAVVPVPSEGESGPTSPWTDVSRPQSTQSSQVHDAVGRYGVETVNAAHRASGISPVDLLRHQRTMSEKSIQATTVTSDRSSTPASTSRASTPALLKMMPRRPPLAPLPTVNFDSEPVRWKALTLEAAQWTFTSEQLQEIVSGAIRQSAAESFIRVLPTQVADAELPQEADRLEQAQYRFNMHRRAMLLQSLVALSQSPQSDSDGEPLYNLTTQLAELTASCDRLLETLVRIADQKAQVAHLQDLHIASALAMALRKLNASYAKRSAELQETRARNDELKAELEEAWNMAQDMAQEMDDLDNFDLDFTDEEFTPDRDDRRNSHLSYRDEHDDEDLSYSALEAEIHSDMDRMSGISSMRNAKVVEITGKAVATKAVMLTSGAPALAPPNSGDRASRVIAAKKRSSRTSKASLRIPKTPTDGNGERRERPDRSSIYSIRRRRSQSRSVRHAGGRNGEGGKEAPEVPIIRLPEPKSREASFLELSQTRPGSPAASNSDIPPPLPPKEGSSPGLQMNIAASRSEEVLPTQLDSAASSSSPTYDELGIPTISIAEEGLGPLPSEAKGPPSSWRAKSFFNRRTQSMQPSSRPADDDTAAINGKGHSALKRSASEAKQFDGWPFLAASKSHRFSVPVLSVIQPMKGRKSSDSDPAGHP
ncbi:hypothetical protein GSI_12679 [Ganoderma sinense ZZ0214-1]|uniref:Uncharacterized protein n=1 Tax=Ganoderma sinense ZZ0214-1 TaxID=1077348 RepID=A0A2G8RTH5_9APHY|nr:hypothetical protein GSI_12679 [Ganoderma sinense ZZ0214-1]